MDISLVRHESHYFWSKRDWQLSACTGLSGLPFALRHLELASKTNLMINSLMHRVIACVEFIPIIGLIAATFEKLIAKRVVTPLDPFDKLVATMEKAFHFCNDRASYVDNGAIDRVLFGSYDTGDVFEPALCHLPHFEAYAEELRQKSTGMTRDLSFSRESVTKKAQMIVAFLFDYAAREGRYDRAEKIRKIFGQVPQAVLRETCAHITADFDTKNKNPIEGVTFLLSQGLTLDFDYLHIKEDQGVVACLFGNAVCEGRYDRAEKIRKICGGLIPQEVLQGVYARIACDFYTEDKNPIGGVMFLLAQGLTLEFDYPTWGLAALIETMCDPGRPCLKDWSPLIQLLGTQASMLTPLRARYCPIPTRSCVVLINRLIDPLLFSAPSTHPFMKPVECFLLREAIVTYEEFLANQQPCVLRKLNLIMGILKHHNVPRNQYPHWIVEVAAKKNWIDVVRACVDYGFNVNSRDEGYPVVLCNYLSADMIRLLIAAGADVSRATPASDLMPLHRADTVVKAKLLLDAGAALTSMGDYFLGRCLYAAHLASSGSPIDGSDSPNFDEMLKIFKLVVSRGAKVKALNYTVDKGREREKFFAAGSGIAKDEKAFQIWIESEQFHRLKLNEALEELWRRQMRLSGRVDPFPEALSCRETTPDALKQIMKHFLEGAREAAFARRSPAVGLWYAVSIARRVRAQKRGGKVISKSVSIASAAWASRRLEALPKAAAAVSS